MFPQKRALLQLEGAEEVGHLEHRRGGSVGAVDRVGLDRLREVLADRAGGGVRGIRGAHEIAPPGDGVVGLQDHRDARALRHEGAQALEERAGAVHGVEAGRVVEAHADHLEREDLEARLLDPREDLAGGPRRHGVRLDDGQRALDAHFPVTFATVAPMSAGLLTSVAPAASSAFIFSAAVPLPPAMMAPAWPMRRPGGAVWPQMKATTGFLTFALMKAAASSSAVPPISPIIMMARVPASSLKRRSTSTNEEPLTGSPPIPTHVDCPMFRALSWP